MPIDIVEVANQDALGMNEWHTHISAFYHDDGLRLSLTTKTIALE
jgi:hypothetical protein